MENQYEEFNGIVGNIEELVDRLLELKSEGRKVKAKFNGKEFFSDTVTYDSAYKDVTGLTKAEFHNYANKVAEKYEKDRKAHVRDIPALSEMWMKRGREVLDKEHWLLWDTIVPVRLNDLYNGIELGNCLDIIKILNEDEGFERAKKLIKSQGHSGMSFGLVCSMVSTFHEKGREFSEYVK